ncbi:MAG: hypothetical protein AMXMBFR84_01270 [Candidatus Hydrogenedentota bacterium]
MYRRTLIKTLIYLVGPLTLTGVLLALYFSGDIFLQRLVSPKLPPLPPDSWREFGLLENFQNLLLICMAAVALRSALTKPTKRERRIFACVTLLSAFVLLEEIDYGAHFVRYWNSDHDIEWFRPVSEWPVELTDAIDIKTEPFNLHNIDDVTDHMKLAANVVLAMLFVVAPIFVHRIRNPWMRYFVPDRFAVGTVVCLVAVRYVTHHLGELERAAVAAHPGNRELGSISRNLSEFRELGMYYLWLIYLIDMAFFRQSPTLSPNEQIQTSRDDCSP